MKKQMQKPKTKKAVGVEQRVSVPTEKLVLVEYDSNNSGGSWWLTDEDWVKLEKAGWKVAWGQRYYENEEDRPKGAKEAEAVRWLGALACKAKKEFNTVSEAIKEFEKITGQDASAEGCNCCGAPHSFSWEGGYCSGEDCLEHLYEKPPATLRDACELLTRTR